MRWSAAWRSPQKTVPTFVTIGGLVFTGPARLYVPHPGIGQQAQSRERHRRPARRTCLALPQPPPIQAAVLNRLADVFRLQVRRALEVGDGAGDLENPMIGPRRQREAGDRGS